MIGKNVRLELFIVVIIISIFVLSLHNRYENKHAYTTTLYMDSTASGPNYDGSFKDPYQEFDDIGWNSLVSDSVIYVRAGVYSPQNTIDVDAPNANGVTFKAVTENNIVPGWNGGDVTVIDDDLSNENLVSLDYSNDCDNVTFEGFTFYCDSLDYGYNIFNCIGYNNYEIQNLSIIDCHFYVNNNYALNSTYIDNLLISACDFNGLNSNSGSIIMFDKDNGVELSDTTITLLSTATPLTAWAMVDVYGSSNTNLLRNKIIVDGDNSSNFGIRIFSNCQTVKLYNNVIYGNFTNYSISDTGANTNVEINHNTVVNTSDSGDGYYATRISQAVIGSFRNNIIKVKSEYSDCYPIFIDCSTPSYWKPATSMCDYNCFYTYGGRNYFGKWYSTPTNDKATWFSITGLDSHSEQRDPYFVDGWRLNSAVAPYTDSSILEGGTYLGSTILDIDKGARNPLKVSMGADQFSEAVFNPSLGTAIDFGTITYDDTKYVTITNYGLSNFEITDMVITYTEPEMFTITSGGYAGSPITVAPGSSHTIGVTYYGSRNNSGEHVLAIQIEHNGFMNKETYDWDMVIFEAQRP